MTTSDAAGNYRRAAILEATAEVFLRYGYKKTSMDDLARAAGLSRQGLYLHFRTKEDLFRASVANVTSGTEDACRAALSRTDLGTVDRLLGAFEAFHGGQVFQADSSHVGDLPLEHERRFVGAVAEFLAASGASRLTSRAEVGPHELAETLLAVSLGLKHRATTARAYRDRMAIALRIALADIPSGETAGRRAVSNFPNR